MGRKPLNQTFVKKLVKISINSALTWLFLILLSFSPAFSQSGDPLSDAERYRQIADSLLFKKIHLDSAENLYLASEKKFSELGDSISLIKCRIKRSETMWRSSLSRLEESKELCKENLELLSAVAPDKELLKAEVLQNIAVIENIQGNSLNAIQFGLQSERIYNKYSDIEPQFLARFYNYLSIFYRDASQQIISLEYSEKAIEATLKFAEIPSLEMATMYNNLANVYRDLGIYDKAQINYVNAYKNIEPLINEYPFYYSQYAHNYGLNFFSLGMYDSAEFYYNKALETYKKDGSISEYLKGDIQFSFGILNIRRGKLDEALEKYNQALEIYKNLENTDSRYAFCSDKIAEVYLKKGQPGKAEEYLKKSNEVYNNMVNALNNSNLFFHLSLESIKFVQEKNIAAARQKLLTLNKYLLDYYYFTSEELSENERIQFLNLISDYFEKFKNFSVQHDEFYHDLLNLMLASKSLLLKSSIKIKERIFQSQDRFLIEKYEELQDLKQTYGKLALTQNKENSKRIKLDSLLLIIDEKDKELVKLTNLYQEEIIYPKWDDLRRKLNKNEMAVKIITIDKYDFNSLKFTGETDYYALIIGKNSISPDLVYLGEEEELISLTLPYYRNSLINQLEDKQTYQRVWKPIAPFVRKADIIYLSVDGAFNHLNFATIWNPEQQRYLIEDHTFYRVTSFGDLIAGYAEVESVNYAFLLGDPLFESNGQNNTENNTTRSLSRLYNVEFKELPATSEELNDIEELLVNNGWKVEKATKKSSTETRLKRIPKPKILHIATHGYFLESSNRKSDYQNLLFNSGLILSQLSDENINDKVSGKEDGILSAYEALDLNISGTELVVLSACKTGLGEIRNGDGVYGLQSSLLTAGAKSLMMSLWNVDDEKTKELMLKFYGNWIRGMGKHDALKNAQLNMIDEGLHPYYWGGFVLLGRN